MLKIHNIISLDEETSKLVQDLTSALLQSATESGRVADSISALSHSINELQSETIIVVGGPFGLTGLPSTLNFEGDIAMPTYLLPNNQADNPYTLPEVKILDQEGEEIAKTDARIKESFDSTDTAVVSILNNGDPRDPDGKVHFGHSGVANLNHVITFTGKDGTPQPIYSASINVTLSTSDAASVETAGDFGLTGLTPVETA